MTNAGWNVPTISAFAAFFLVAGCHAAETTHAPDPAPETSGMKDGAANQTNLLRLSGEGVAITGPAGATLDFGSPADTVEHEVGRILGAPVEKNSNDECGAGPVQFASYAGGLTLNFQDGQLVGWTLDRSDDGGIIETDKRIGVGASEAELTKVYSVEELEDSTLGDEFYSAQGVGGFYSGSEGAKTVESLFAGTTCFFR